MTFTAFVLKNLTRRAIRTALTILGLAVAVGSMVALLGISDNVEREVSESFVSRGVDLVVIESGRPTQTDSDLDEKLVDRVRAIPGVERVDAALAGLTEITRPSGSSVPALSFGWPPDNFAFEDLKIRAGRVLHAGDAHKAMLGYSLAETLHKGVGDTIQLQGEDFQVVGVFQSQTVFENGAVAITLKEAQRLAVRPGRISGFSVVVHKSLDHPAADVDAVRRQIEALTDSAGKPIHLSAQTVQDYVQSSTHLRILRALAWLVSVVAVVIGVISMLNTMIMSVLERTQEIGILRAVGWPRSRVVRMVVGESVFLGLASAAVGTVGAMAFIALLTQFPKVSGFIAGGISIGVVLRGFALTILIGLLGSVYPAIRAASLLPTEAIRHD